MSQDLEREIAQIRKIVEENNKIVKGLQKKARYATLISILKWVIYIAIATGIYLLAKPIIDQATQTYGMIQESAKSISEVKSQFNNDQINSFLELFKK